MTEAPPSPSSSFNASHVLGYVALCLIWGSTWLAIRFLVQDVPPLEAAGIRFAIASMILLGLAWLQKRAWPRGEGEWRATLVLSLTMMAIPFGLVFWAEQYVASSMTAILYSASPLTISLFMSIFMHRKVPRRAVLGMVIAFGGILILFYSGLNASRRSLLGGAAVLTAMTVSAWATVYAKQRLQNLDNVVSTGLQLFFGSIALGWASWALESRLHAAWTRPAVVALAFLTLVGSCVAFVVYYWLLKHMQPYQLATTGLVVPLIAVLEGSLIAREAVPWTMVIVIVIVLAAVGSVLRAEALGEQEIQILTLRDKA